MADIPFETMERRSAYCSCHGVVIQFDEPDWGLDAFLWRTTVETVVKIHRYHERCQKELATYQRLAERKIVRLKGFAFPQLVKYDEELHILELSIVSPPYILDFVEVGLGQKPGNVDIERIETQQPKQFGNGHRKRCQEPIVRSTLRAIWLLVPAPFSAAADWNLL
ncbi:MAG: hypothetical protein R3C17_14870 [Planctomycetaceae bacterium]